MGMVRSQSNFLAVTVLAILCVLASRTFVPAPQESHSVALRGVPVAAGVAALGTPLAAHAEDAYIRYQNAGEFTPFMIGSYFVITTGCTFFAFACYFILTKLKII